MSADENNAGLLPPSLRDFVNAAKWTFAERMPRHGPMNTLFGTESMRHCLCSWSRTSARTAMKASSTE